MTNKKQPTSITANRTDRSPDCVTEVRMGNTVLVVSGFFKQDATETADDKMVKVIQAAGAGLDAERPA